MRNSYVMARRAEKAVGFGGCSANSEGWLRTVILQWLALLDVWRAWAPACGVRLYVDDAIILISWDACCAYDAVPLGLLPVLPVAGHSPLMQGAILVVPGAGVASQGSRSLHAKSREEQTSLVKSKPVS